MLTHIINIGNSKGVIIPSKLLKHLNLSNDSVVEVQEINDSIIIKKPKSRTGWLACAKAMHQSGDDQLTFEDFNTDFENKDWTW